MENANKRHIVKYLRIRQRIWNHEGRLIFAHEGRYQIDELLIQAIQRR
ncbi:hypothetical protein P872_11580 [Rhodonellum psychrophilum GCM71 = DSM 17998]|uniref:Uncharacterized protein n=1 Tax=Rhodonellum psychrophilum GCM71 = DSM 17998 TaxID=1123057 RepID=U5BKB5_9BACT|nr:hypothetical protein P872_11580 [Rhodonellum psychrophilum GCM71 = DSM 17998]